jgi:hypothetical protein
MICFLAQFRPEQEAPHEPVPNVERRILRLLVTEAFFKHLTRISRFGEDSGAQQRGAPRRLGYLLRTDGEEPHIT